MKISKLFIFTRDWSKKLSFIWKQILKLATLFIIIFIFKILKRIDKSIKLENENGVHHGTPLTVTLMYCCLPTELQSKLSKMVKVTYILMIIYYATPIIPLYSGFHLFPLSRAVNSNRLFFHPSEV